MSLFERVLWGIAASIIVVTIAVTGHGAGADDGAASTDGRVHGCGVVTEQGVTEHLAAYTERCYPVNKP